MSTHLSPGRSLERKLHCTGCEGPGEATRGPNRRQSLRPESYTGSLNPEHQGRRRRERRSGRSRGCSGRTRGMGRASPRGWSQWGRKGKVAFGARKRRDWQPHPLSCYWGCSRHRWTRTPLEHTHTHTGRYARWTCRQTDTPTKQNKNKS